MKINIRQSIPLLSMCTAMLLGINDASAFSSMISSCPDTSSCTSCHSPSICPAPSCTDLDGDGFSIEGGSCGLIDFNDNSAAAYPGADEICTDGIDNDGNGLVDASDSGAVDCPMICTDVDQDGFFAEGADCGTPVDFNDYNPDVYPGAPEICTDGIDNNGDGLVDAADPNAEFCPMICTDLDGDSYSVEGGDCGPVDFNDNNANAYPFAIEDCLDGIDNDGNGLADAADPNAVNCPLTCTDLDSDGYNIDGGECGPMDCNDNDPAINPGAAEICTDSIDNNCNGTIDTADMNAVDCPLTCTDMDADGYSIEGGDCGAIDCDDANNAVNPAALEICDDSIDNNCNNLTDVSDSVCQVDDVEESDDGIRQKRAWWRDRIVEMKKERRYWKRQLRRQQYVNRYHDDEEDDNDDDDD